MIASSFGASGAEDKSKELCDQISRKSPLERAIRVTYCSRILVQIASEYRTSIVLCPPTRGPARTLSHSIRSGIPADIASLHCSWVGGVANASTAENVASPIPRQPAMKSPRRPSELSSRPPNCAKPVRSIWRDYASQAGKQCLPRVASTHWFTGADRPFGVEATAARSGSRPIASQTGSARRRWCRSRRSFPAGARGSR